MNYVNMYCLGLTFFTFTRMFLFLEILFIYQLLSYDLTFISVNKITTFEDDAIALWRRQWHPTPVLLPGKSHGWRNLVGCNSWDPKSQTRLSDLPFTFHFRALEKEMATHSSVLAWRIPGMGESGGLPSMRSHRAGHD